MTKKRRTPCTCLVATIANAEIRTSPALRVFKASGVEVGMV
jgi:hypothetical protein